MHPKLTDTFSPYDTIILVGGGTGGHIQPILNLSEELKSSKKLFWIGGKGSTEEQEAGKINIDFKGISTLKLSTTLSPKIFFYPFVLMKGILEARKILLSIMSTQGDILLRKEQDVSQDSKGQKGETRNKKLCVFSKGGPGSVAIGIAAWTLSIPLYIHESDTVPGKSSQILGKIATRIFLGFEGTKKYFRPENCETIGQILHPVFLGKVKSEKGKIQWKTPKPHILVICGSQGARAIFDAIILQFSGNDAYEWIISLGKLNAHMKDEFKKMKNTQALEWISQEDIAHLLSGTDLTITRGSATTLAEIDIFGVEKVIIPLPYSAGDHQYWNAKEYEEKGDILLEQKDISKLKETLEKYAKKC